MPKGRDIVKQKFISHKIQGIGIVPDILDLNIVDEYLFVSYEEVLDEFDQIL